jgi:hypothetical protein
MDPTLPVLESPFFKEVPDDIEPLFHYTDAGGLIGMVQYKKLWLTSIHYQNDSQEYYHAFSLVQEVLEKHYPGLLQAWSLLSMNNTSTVFTFSLSTKKDSLSQWRGYCPDGGFAISFNRDQFNQFIKREEISVAKCIYDKDDQEKFIIEHVIGFTPEYYAEKKALEEAPHYQYDPKIMYFNKKLLDKISSIAPLLKHKGFSDEEEWRLIKVIQTSSESKSLGDSVERYWPENTIKVRARKNKLIPYIELSMKHGDDNPVAISQVVVSPTSHKELASDACRALLYMEGRVNNYDVKIENSKIPYVNW